MAKENTPRGFRMDHYLKRGRVIEFRGWTRRDMDRICTGIASAFRELLPEGHTRRVFLKVNFNNDMNGLTGNSTDFRFLLALIRTIRERGGEVTIADGSNAGVNRRGIDVFRRLRADRLAGKGGASILDLNRDRVVNVPLSEGVVPVSESIVDAPLLINVAKVKTHAEMGLTLSLKNAVGWVKGDGKRRVHFDLPRNIVALNQFLSPHLHIVEGIVGMEGNGPGDGIPFRFGRVFVSPDPFLLDLVVTRAVGFPIERNHVLMQCLDLGILSREEIEEVKEKVPEYRKILPPPRRSRLALLQEKRLLYPLKLATRPFLNAPVMEFAYRMRIIQDVYSKEDDGVTAVRREPSLCRDCHRCEELCPTSLKWEEIGTVPPHNDCILCLYCFFACPAALSLTGNLGYLERHIKKYKGLIERL